MKNPPILLTGQFSPVTVGKNHEKLLFLAKVTDIFVACTFKKSRTEKNVMFWFFEVFLKFFLP